MTAKARGCLLGDLSRSEWPCNGFAIALVDLMSVAPQFGLADAQKPDYNDLLLSAHELV